MREICFMRNKLYQWCFVLFLGFVVSSCRQEITYPALGPVSTPNTSRTYPQRSETPPKAESANKNNDRSGDKKAVINGQEATLSENGEGKCRLSTGDAAIDLDIPAGCDFHRLPNGEVRVFPKDFIHFYGKGRKKVEKQYRGVSIILTEQYVPLEAASKKCRTQLQAIRIEGPKIEKAKKPMIIASCPAGLWDEKNFTAPFQVEKQK